MSLRPVPTEFPFSFAPIQADRLAVHSAVAAVFPASEAAPVLGLHPIDFARGECGSGGAWLPPFPETPGPVLPLCAPLAPPAPVSSAPACSDLACALTPIAVDAISHQPAMPCLAGTLERAPKPSLAAAAAVEFEHPVEERLVEPAVAGCARSPNAPRLPGAAPAIAAPPLEWPGFQAPLQPSAAVRPARPRVGFEAALYPHAAALPAFQVETRGESAEDAALLERIPPPGRTLLALPNAEAVERWIAVSGTIKAVLPAVGPVTLPALELESVDPTPMLQDRAGWLAPLEPEPVEIAAHALTELKQLALPTPAPGLPTAAMPPFTATQAPERQSWQEMERAEAVEMLLRPAMVEALPATPALALPQFARFHRGGAGELAGTVRVDMPLADPSWEAVTAESVESLPAEFQTAALQLRPKLCLPGFEVQAAEARPMAGFDASGPAPLRPPADQAFQPPLEPAARFAITAPDSGLAPPSPAMAAAPPIPLEFFFRAPAGTLHKRISAIPTAPQPMLPAWNLQPAAERLPEAREPQRSPRADLAEVFKMPGARLRRVRPIAADAFKALAASLLVGSLLWYGVPEIRQARRLVLLNRGGSLPSGSIAAVNGTRRESGEAPSWPGRNPGPGPLPGSASPGLMGRIRGAIASRATVEIADSFHGGMSAWGAGGKALAPGWSRSSAGFVRPGQLALLRPSLGFADYRLEFLGEIENKSMDWVVRAADSKNYYAMKFTVVVPGPRPTIAMVHYPVVGGKAGHRVEIPLGVMVHNHTPYRVSVDVSGDRIVTSIEGEEVDSWTDGTLSKGGVGFFADAGERARLYWVKLAHNNDWIGRVCAYFAEDGSQAVAELRPCSTPLPERRSGSGGAGDEPVLAAAALAFQRRRRFPFFRIAEPRYSEPKHQDHRRFPLCHPS